MSNKEISSNFLFVELPFYIVIALPFLLVTGPFLSDLAISFVAINFIFILFYIKIINILIISILNYFYFLIFLFG